MLSNRPGIGTQARGVVDPFAAAARSSAGQASHINEISLLTHLGLLTSAAQPWPCMGAWEHMCSVARRDPAGVREALLIMNACKRPASGLAHSCSWRVCVRVSSLCRPCLTCACMHACRLEAEASGTDLLDTSSSLQSGVFGVLFTITKEKLNNGWKFFVLRFSLDFIQLFSLVFYPPIFGWRVNTDLWWGRACRRSTAVQLMQPHPCPRPRPRRCRCRCPRHGACHAMPCQLAGLATHTCRAAAVQRGVPCACMHAYARQRHVAAAAWGCCITAPCGPDGMAAAAAGCGRLCRLWATPTPLSRHG